MKMNGKWNRLGALALCVMLALAMLSPVLAVADDDNDKIIYTWILRKENEGISRITSKDDASVKRNYQEGVATGSTVLVGSADRVDLPDHSVQKGDKLQLLEWKDGMCKVIVNGTRTGWIPGEYIRVH